MLLLPMTTLEAAKSVAKKLRTTVETAAFHHHGQPVPVTISCGLTDFRAGDTVAAVFERADRALYGQGAGPQPLHRAVTPHARPRAGRKRLLRSSPAETSEMSTPTGKISTNVIGRR